MLRRMLQAAEVDIDATELTMKLEQAAARKEEFDGKVKREASRSMRNLDVGSSRDHDTGDGNARTWRRTNQTLENEHGNRPEQ